MNKQVKLEQRDILSHLVLHCPETASKIANTPEWKDQDETLELDIKVNGIVLDTEIFRKVMESMWEQANKSARDSVDAEKYNERVQVAAKKIVKDQASEVMDALYGLQSKVEEVDKIIKWDWE